MKAIVLEVKNGTSACLREDGTVVKVHKKYPVGMSIELKESNIVQFKEGIAKLGESRAVTFIRDNAQKAAMAAAALLVVFLGTGIYSYNNLMTASYMSVDVNPSLEYSLNRLNKVIGVQALNEDAEKIVEELKEAGIKNSTVAETISETTKILEQEKYIAEDKDNIMLVGITGANKTKSGDINNEVQTVAGEEMVDRVSVYTLETTKKDRKEAKKHGVSAGRYASAKALCDKNNIDLSTISDADFEELSKMSVASLVGEEENKAVEKEEKDDKETKDNDEKTVKKAEAKAVTEPAVSTANASASTAAVAAAPQVSSTASAAVNNEEEEKEEKSSSSSKKKKTVSGSSAKKSKTTVSESATAEAEDTAESSSASAGTASGNNTSGESSGASAKAGTTTTVVTDDGTVVTVVVPDASQIGSPQDTSVGEYEQEYKEIVTTVTTPTDGSETQTAATDTTQTETTEESEKSSEESESGTVKIQSVKSSESAGDEETS